MKTGNENKITDDAVEKTNEGISDLSDFLDDIQNTLNTSLYSSSEKKKASSIQNDPLYEEKPKKTASVKEEVAAILNESEDAGNESGGSCDGAADFDSDFNNIFDIIKNNGAQKAEKSAPSAAKIEYNKTIAADEEDEDIKIYSGESADDEPVKTPEDYFFDNIKNEVISSKNTQNAEQVMNIINDSGDTESGEESYDYFGLDIPPETSPSPAKPKRKSNTATNKKTVPGYEKIKNSILYKFSETEYTSFDQTDGVFKQYSKYYAWEFFHIAACLILFLLEFYLEIAPFFKLKLPYVLDINYYNTVYIPLDWQILFLACAVMNKSLIYGFKSLIRNIINIHAVASVVAFVTFLQTLLTYIIMYNKPGIRLYNSVVIGLFIFIAIGNLLSIQKESLAFKMIYAKRSKFGVKILKNNSHEGDCFQEYINDDHKIGLSQVASFISNFFSTTNKKLDNKPLKIILLAMISISVIMFGIMTVLKRDVYSSVSNVILFILASAPFCASITAVYPFYKTQRKLKEKGATIIGEDSIENYSNISVFSVYDRDIFPPELIKVSGIRIYSDDRIDTVIKCLCSLCDKINSPLYHVLKASVNFDPVKDMKEVDIIDIKDNGIFFKISSKNFYVGNSEYISDLGLLIPKENVDENFDDTFIKSSGNIMYFSTGDKVIGKFYLKYELTPDFADIIKNLARLNICLGIRTSDPNITNESIQKIVANKKTVINIVKLYDVNERQIVEENLTTGIVSKNNVKSLIEALISCNKTNNVIKTNMLVQIMAFVVGAVIAGVMIFSGDISKISVLHLILIQIFWFLPVLLLSNLTPH